MTTLPDDLVALLGERHSVPVATTGADGTPNVAPRSVTVRNAETIVRGELSFMRTYGNLRRHPVASLAAWRTIPPYTAYRVNGRVTVHEHDEVAAGLDRRVLTGHDAEFGVRVEGMAAVVLSVESVRDQTPRPESAGVRIARGRHLAVFRA